MVSLICSLIIILRVSRGQSKYGKALRFFLKTIWPFLPGNSLKKTKICSKIWSFLGGASLVSLRSNQGEDIVIPINCFEFVLQGVDYKRFGLYNFYPIAKKYITKNSIVIDVGSSWGEEIIFLSRLAGEKGEVHCFEINPLTFEALKLNIERNSLNNVFAHKVAISNNEGYFNFKKFEEIDKDLEENKLNLKDTVPMTTLDSFFKDRYKEISFIKVDTDGSDMEVIKGAKTIFKEANPACIVEYLPKFNYSGLSGSDVLEKYIEMGFDLNKITIGTEKIKKKDINKYLKDYSLREEEIAHDILLKKIK